MIVLIDNYDSFVHNLARYLRRLGQETRVLRNDVVTATQVVEQRPDAIVLSPGPCTPAEAGCSVELVRLAAQTIPLLGVCLGHQAIAVALGGKLERASPPMHGRASAITHDGQGLFAGLPTPLTVGRYHSLVIAEPSLPTDLTVTARTSDDVIMAVAHRHWPLWGVQFHPESILTDCGYEMLGNFLSLAGIEGPDCLPSIGDERPPQREQDVVVSGPVTF